jgi:hypothetical protein
MDSGEYVEMKFQQVAAIAAAVVVIWYVSINYDSLKAIAAK